VVNGGMKLKSAAKESNKTHGDNQRNNRKQEQERELSKQRNCPLSVLLKAPRSCELFVKGLVAVFAKLTLIKCSMNAKLAGLYKERGALPLHAPGSKSKGPLTTTFHSKFSIGLFLGQSKSLYNKNLIDTYHVA
jgi:hypothetical protein